MIITDIQIKELRPFIKNIDEIVLKNNVDELLSTIDDIIVDNILGNNDEPDDTGVKLQLIYDQIYNQN